jgi:chemotaxis protein MotA
MLVIVGIVVVLASVMGGYLAGGGHLGVLFQPFEFLIIVGAAVGGFFMANRKPVLSGAAKAIPALFKAEAFNKEAYLELLTMLYTIFKMAKTKGALVLEAHVEKPHESTVFARFPTFLHDHHAVTFLCDYLRLLTLGTDNHHEMETLIDEDLSTHREEHHAIAGAISNVSDAMPALGIVAAVLGIIHTMGSITEPPAVLGELIGGSLVGTFLGILMSYGFIAPLAAAVKGRGDAEERYYLCMKAGILAYMQGYAPSVAVEFARKALNTDVRPTFYEVEEAVEKMPQAA